MKISIFSAKKLIASFSIVAILSNSAFAATFVVNDAGDGGDFAIDGVCEVTNGGADCTFRAALDESNANPGSDTINTDNNYIVNNAGTGYTISDELTVDTLGNDLSLNGNGTVDTGIDIIANNVSISGVSVYGFDGSGIAVGSGTNNTQLINNNIGVEADQTTQNNNTNGVSIAGNNVLISDSVITATNNAIEIEGNSSNLTILNNNINVLQDGGGDFNVEAITGDYAIEADNVDFQGALISINGNRIGGDPISLDYNGGAAPTVNLSNNNIGLGEDGVTDISGTAPNQIQDIDTLIVDNNKFAYESSGLNVTNVQNVEIGTSTPNTFGLQADGLGDAGPTTQCGINVDGGNSVEISGNYIVNMNNVLCDGAIEVNNSALADINNNKVGLGTDDLTPGTLAADIDGIATSGNADVEISGNVVANLTSPGTGIAINSNNDDQVLIDANIIGFAADGDTAASVAETGIQITANPAVTQATISNNQIGNVLTGSAVVISGNPSQVDINDNLIGVASDGFTANGIGNSGDSGILINQAQTVNINGNTIAAIFGAGIRLLGGQNISILSNMIGVSSDGLSAIGMAGSGIIANSINITGLTIGDFDAGNVIGATGSDGIFIQTLQSALATVSIQANYIGTNFGGSATTGFANDGNGIRANVGSVTIGGDSNFNNELGAGAAIGEGNVISGNNLHGIELSPAVPGDISAMNIFGNIIGLLDPNSDNNFDTEGGNNASGIHSGVAMDSVQIGSSTGISAGSRRNVISGNGTFGINIQNNVTTLNIFNNFIGTSQDGLNAVGNDLSGIQLEAMALSNIAIGDGLGANGNLLSGNAVAGLLFYNFANSVTAGVYGNLIGVNALGTAALANNTLDSGAAGIVIQETASANINIGGDNSNANSRNTISGNIGAGIYVNGTDNNLTIRGNYIGTSATGAASIPNTLGTGLALAIRGAGIAISDSISASTNILIGGSAATDGNVISGNSGSGLAYLADIAGGGLNPAGSINYNLIGVAADGTSLLPNGASSILFDGGATVADENFSVGSAFAQNKINTADTVGIQVIGATVTNLATIALDNICSYPNTILGAVCVSSIIPPAPPTPPAGGAGNVLVIVNNPKPTPTPTPEPTPAPEVVEPQPVESENQTPLDPSSEPEENVIILSPETATDNQTAPATEDASGVYTNTITSVLENFGSDPALVTLIQDFDASLQNSENIFTASENTETVTILQVILEKFIDANNVAAIQNDVSDLTKESIEAQFNRLPGEDVVLNLGGGKTITVNNTSNFEVKLVPGLSDTELAKLTNQAQSSGQQVIVIGPYTDLDSNGVSDLIQFSQKMYLFEEDPDNDNFSVADELFFNTSPIEPTKLPNIARVTNLNGMTAGSFPSIRLMGLKNRVIQVTFRNVQTGEQINIGEVTIDEGHKGEIRPQSAIPDGEWYIVLKDQFGKYGDLAKVKIDAAVDLAAPAFDLILTSDGEIKVIDTNLQNPINDFDQISLNTDESVIVNLTHKSVILSSTLISDAGQVKFDPPKDLPTGDHEIVAYSYDPSRKLISSSTVIKIRRQ